MASQNRSFFNQEHEIFRKTVRAFIEKEILPHQKKWESEKFVPKEIFLKLAEQGFLGINFDSKYGGSDCDYWTKVVFAEEMTGCRMNGFAMDVFVHSDFTTPVIHALGTEEQKQKFLIPAIKGEKIFALGVTEPNAGSDVARIRTSAKKEGDFFIINGSKTYITNGSRADFILLAVRTGPAITNSETFKAGPKGLSFIVFPTKDENGNPTPGFKVGRKLEKMGNYSSDTAELSFENCRVPINHLIGQENQGFYYVMQNFQGERLIAAIMATTCCQLMWNDTLNFLKEREAFGKRIIDFQIWKHRLAFMATEIQAAQELTYRACDLFDKKENAVKEISMAKLFCCELANKVAYQCQQAFGGAGYIEEYDIARMYRDLRLLTIGGGTSEIMTEIIAKEIGLYE